MFVVKLNEAYIFKQMCCFHFNYSWNIPDWGIFLTFASSSAGLNKIEYKLFYNNAFLLQKLNKIMQDQFFKSNCYFDLDPY